MNARFSKIKVQPSVTVSVTCCAKNLELTLVICLYRVFSDSLCFLVLFSGLAMN